MSSQTGYQLFSYLEVEFLDGALIYETEEQ